MIRRCLFVLTYLFVGVVIWENTVPSMTHDATRKNFYAYTPITAATFDAVVILTWPLHTAARAFAEGKK